MGRFTSLQNQLEITSSPLPKSEIDSSIPSPEERDRHLQWRRNLRLFGALSLTVLFLLGLRMTVLASSSAASHTGYLSALTEWQTLELHAVTSGSDDENPAGSDEIEISGAILSVPDHELGYGNWSIRSSSGHIYAVVATSETEFRPQPPQINQSVKVKGIYRHSQQGDEIEATRIEIEDEREEDSRNDRIQGILVEAPANGFGAWQVQTGFSATVTVVADAQTRLDDGVPSAGAWLEIRGQWQTDNTFTATRIRVDDHQVNEVIVRLAPNVISSTVASRYELTAKETLLRSGNIHLFMTREDEEKHIVEQLVKDSDVLWAELNFVGGIPEGHGYKTWRWGGTTPSGYVNQNAFEQINLGPALDNAQGAGTVIAILDTGINHAHSAFTGRIVSGYDMVDDDADPEDEGDGVGWGHGTHIAGIVAKVSPQSKLLPVRVLNSNGRGNTFALAYAIEWSVEQGADVINLSLGADATSNVLRDVIEEAVARGVIIVAAAGNINTNTPQFPASLPDVISVTAVDGENTKADFASFGADWVDIAAPGVGITSTIIGPYGSGYASWSGTSMSTGFVSGAAALLRQQMPTASVATIQELFTSHTQDLDATNPSYAGQLGGLLDVAAALDLNGPAPTLTPVATSTPSPSPTATPTPTATPFDPTTGQIQVYLPAVRR